MSRMREGTHREGLLVSDLHHVIHNIKINGSWNGVFANALTLQQNHTAWLAVTSDTTSQTSLHR